MCTQPCRQAALAERSLPAPSQISNPLHWCPPAPHPGNKQLQVTDPTEKQEQTGRFTEEPTGCRGTPNHILQRTKQPKDPGMFGARKKTQGLILYLKISKG